MDTDDGEKDKQQDEEVEDKGVDMKIEGKNNKSTDNSVKLKNKEQQMRKDGIESKTKKVKEKSKQDTPEIEKNKTNDRASKKDPAITVSAINYLRNNKSRKFLLLKPGEMWREEKGKFEATQ